MKATEKQIRVQQASNRALKNLLANANCFLCRKRERRVGLATTTHRTPAGSVGCSCDENGRVAGQLSAPKCNEMGIKRKRQSQLPGWRLSATTTDSERQSDAQAGRDGGRNHLLKDS